MGPKPRSRGNESPVKHATSTPTPLDSKVASPSLALENASPSLSSDIHIASGKSPKIKNVASDSNSASSLREQKDSHTEEKHSAPPATQRQRRFHYLRSPWHVVCRFFSRRILVTIETASGEQICKRRFRRSSDCLDMIHAAYRYDEKSLLTPRVPVGDDGGIAAFRCGDTIMGPGRTLRRVTPLGEQECTIRVVSHVDFFKRRCRRIPNLERISSERRAKRAGNEVKLVPYKYDEKQPMDFITLWRPYGHCAGFFRPSSEGLSRTPLSERPGNVERKWISFDVDDEKFYPEIKYGFWATENLPTENMHYGHHPSLSIKDFEEAAIKATMGRYKLYESNCQTTLLSIYEDMGLADYASKFDNMLLRKGIQTREKIERCRSEHFSVEPFPDKGCLAYCEPEALVVCCGRG